MTVFIILLILALLVLGAMYYVYRMAFHPVPIKGDRSAKALNNPQFRAQRDHINQLIADMEARPYELVSIVARDGVRLTGRYYHQADGAPLDIGFHGYRGSPIRDFSGGAKCSFEAGHNVLLVNERSQNGSEGRCITFGILEHQDCLEWITYANERFGSPDMIIFGVSMGAATILMAAGLDLPDNICGIIADSPYSTPLDIICEVGKEMHIPAPVTAALAIGAARIFGGFDLRAASAAEAVKKAKAPILIIHGENDHFVPCGMSSIIAQNCASPVQLETFPNAEHGLSYLTDTPRYERLVQEFIKEVSQ